MDTQLFILLLAGHYLADFALQPRFMAESKALVFVKSIGFHSLTSHAFVHGLTAGLITQSYYAGALVGATHWLIDALKASKVFDDRYPHTKGARKNGQTHGLYGINVDQALHLAVLVFVATFYA